MAKETYIIDLTFGTWQNQIWFCDGKLCESGEPCETEVSDRRWADAKQTLEDVGEHCTNPSEFFNEAVKHFEKHGFIRIQR